MRHSSPYTITRITLQNRVLSYLPQSKVCKRRDVLEDTGFVRHTGKTKLLTVKNPQYEMISGMHAARRRRKGGAPLDPIQRQENSRSFSLALINTSPACKKESTHQKPGVVEKGRQHLLTYPDRER